MSAVSRISDGWLRSAANEVNCGFAGHSVCDHETFALGIPRSRTTHHLCREKATLNARCRPRQSVLRSPIWRARIAKYRHNSRISTKNKAGNSLQSRLRGGAGWIRTFGTGFEPPKPRGVRKLQITKLQQRIFCPKLTFDFLISAVSFRYSIYPKRRIPGDSVAESGRLLERFFHPQIPTQ